MKNETVIYINMDKSLIEKGGRTASRISKEELRREIYNLQSGNKSDGGKIEDFTWKMINMEKLSENAQISEDLSEITFYKRIDVPVKWEKESLMGIHKLPNGLSFMGVTAGHICDVSVFFILYWSGSMLRAYIPKYGNTFNPDFKTALGSEGSNKTLNNEEIFSKPPYKGCRDGEADVAYIRSLFSYDKDAPLRLYINWDAVKEDILSRIEVI